MKKKPKKRPHPDDIETNATASIILGILSVILGAVPLVGWILIYTGIHHGLSAYRHGNQKEKDNAMIGIILCVLGILSAILGLIAFLVFVVLSLFQ
ncbi:MAG: hypothetical protein KKG59_03220 [Nanoarchaeota archaeon]|nr:hypothetical protein [Nanoarchaeota archaeon]